MIDSHSRSVMVAVVRSDWKFPLSASVSFVAALTIASAILTDGCMIVLCLNIMVSEMHSVWCL